MTGRVSGEPSTPGTRHAYVFYATNDAYAVAVLVFACRLDQIGARANADLVVLHLPLSDDLLANMRERGLVTRLVPALRSVGSRHYRDCGVKLRLFELLDYDRLVFVDADALPLRGLDALFTLPMAGAVAAPRAYWLPQPCWTSALLAVRPSAELWSRVRRHVGAGARFGHYDMDVINTEFGGEMCTLPASTLCLDSEWEDAGRPGQFGEPDDAYARVSVVHFSAMGKPWQHPPDAVRRLRPDAHPIFYELRETWWRTRDEVLGRPSGPRSRPALGRAGAPGAALDGVLATALTSPSELTRAALDTVAAALDPSDAAPWTPALAAILYARGDLADPALVGRLAGLLGAPPLTEPAARAVTMALEALAGTDLAGPVATVTVRLLSSDGPAAARPYLVSLLRACASWCPERLDLEAVVELAARPALEPFHESLLGQVLEPLLGRDPERLTEATLDRLRTVFGDCARLPYALQLIGERPGAARPVRLRAAGLTASAFPVRALAREVLGRCPFALLAVVNVRIGQGDEIVRLAALLQALLDANPALRVTVVTPRGYLYDHPRVEAVAVLDEPALDVALAHRYDGVIHVLEPGWPEVAWHPPLDGRVQELLAGQRPPFVLTATVGYNHFVYRSVQLAGQEIAATRSLDRLAVENIYDGCRRLLAELGLPARVAEERAHGQCPLTGQPSPDADRAWTRLTAGLERPIALVNPFGGAQRIKGYPPERPDGLAAELAGLAAEGYGIVLLPNGTAWGTREAATRVVARLPPAARARVVVAPDPAETEPARRMGLTERPDLSYPDRVMRLFKYFAARADLIATVEGWLGHLAYALGQPFRLVLRAQSFSYDWHPPIRGPRQRLSLALSPGSVRTAPAAAFQPGDPAPLPPRDRKPLLLAALAGVPGLEPGRALPILVRALASEDHDVRSAAVAALGRLLPAEPALRSLLEALRDPEPLVRRTAAEALLAGGVDCSTALGGGFRDHLAAHRDIARQDWPAVRRLGAAALPALFVAADGANDVVRREARRVAASALARLGVAQSRGSDR